MKRHRILMVDDDANLLEFTRLFLEQRGFSVHTATSGAEAVERIRLAPTQYSVVILDYQMPSQDGASTTRQILHLHSAQKILIYSGDGSREAFLSPSRSGASGFVDKGEGPAVFLSEIQRLCREAEAETHMLSGPGSKQKWVQSIQTLGMVGASAALAGVAAQVERLRNRSGAVLILGESGTGKELVARALHAKRNGPFLAVNCADFLMSPGTARSELFGHSKGAFTGATADHKGVFERAGNGTLFLDEIHSLPTDAQWGLLRALQEKQATRLGDGRTSPIHCRIIAAGKPDLERAVQNRSFTPDLYFRISQNTLRIPPLRDRIEDIEPLVIHLCRKWSEENAEEKHFSQGAVAALRVYSWPGNVRELENTVFGMLNMSLGMTVQSKELPAVFQHPPVARESEASLTPLRQYVESTERAYILEAASQSRTLKEAAHRLGVTPQNLIRLFKKHGIQSKQALAKSALKRGRQ